MADKADRNDQEQFPWHLGVFDAHCHPTDTMSSIRSIPDMKARFLTTFSTRAEDQTLVAQVADELGVKDSHVAIDTPKEEQCVIPGFGWHPWFSHQLYDDTSGSPDIPEEKDTTKHKREHYQAVLVPMPDEEDFLESLPVPRPLSTQIEQTRSLLTKYPLALVGEIGLDKSFRLPAAWSAANDNVRDPELTPGGRDGRRLTPYRVSMEHQKKVLQRQLNLAGEMQRAVSVHGVQAHGVVFEALQETWKGYEKEVTSKRTRKRRGSVPEAHMQEQESQEREDGAAEDASRTTTGTATVEHKGRSSKPLPYPPRICLHSYSGPQEGLKQYLNPAIPADIFFSFSSVINFSNSNAAKVQEVIRSVPDDRILVESDLHCAGDRMDGYLEDITRLVCQAKGWPLEDGVRQLGRNWQRFIFGK
ncbi:MAG: hypothetical protein M1823_002460 [Watsoniomyces obsoletus]|nr:MAG: hypothetical protein M1823_002460 [Watsoniomyces obsoletus]